MCRGRERRCRTALFAPQGNSQCLRFVALEANDHECVPQGLHFCAHVVEPGTKEVERGRGREHGVVLGEGRLVAMP